MYKRQHDGWFEAVLQSELKGQEIIFRNLGFTGDTVKERPRNQGFPSPETYLKICEADVIFVFFGYNESFKGENGLESFMNDLSAMIDNYKSSNLMENRIRDLYCSLQSRMRI